MGTAKGKQGVAPEEIPVKHRLIELFWNIGPGFTRWAESHMHHEGLTPQRVRLMWHLRENGALKMNELSEALGVTATNVTALVDALEKDAMVVRKAHPTDRRVTIVAITLKAEKRLDEHCAELKDSVSELFADFTKKEQSQLLELLMHTREALVKRGILEPSERCGAMKKRPS